MAAGAGGNYVFGLRVAPPVPVSITLGNPGTFTARPCPHPSPSTATETPVERGHVESQPWPE